MADKNIQTYQCVSLTPWLKTCVSVPPGDYAEGGSARHHQRSTGNCVIKQLVVS